MIDFSKITLNFDDYIKSDPITYQDCKEGDLVLYRYEPTPDGLTAYAFPILKKTPCGHIISVYSKNKFVSENTRKRYAYPTIEQALDAFIFRKQKQISILSSQLERAKDLLILCQNLKNVQSLS